MGTGIAQREWFPGSVAPDHERLLEQHRRHKSAAADLLACQRAVPEPEQHQRIRALLLKWKIFRHWTGENTAGVSSFPSAHERVASFRAVAVHEFDFVSRLAEPLAHIFRDHD